VVVKHVLYCYLRKNDGSKVLKGRDPQSFCRLKHSLLEYRIVFQKLNIPREWFGGFKKKSLPFFRYLDFKKIGIQVFRLDQYEEAVKTVRGGGISKALFKVQ